LKVEHSQGRPSLRTLAIVLALVVVIVAAGIVTNQYAIAALVTTLICMAVIALWVVRGKRGKR
jgi:uncharacterized membrane protein (GlpM family)